MTDEERKVREELIADLKYTLELRGKRLGYTLWEDREDDSERDISTILAMDKECAELRKELEAYKLIFDATFSIVLNANDFFGYACAYATQIDYGHGLNALIRLTKEYGSEGIDAAMSVAAGEEPIEPHRTEKFKEAVASVTDEERKWLHEVEVASDWPELEAKYRKAKEENKRLREKLIHKCNHNEEINNHRICPRCSELTEQEVG